MDALKAYADLAPWFHLFTAPADYAEEAELYSSLLFEHCEEGPETVLELGSGGGNNASHAKRHFTLTLTDLSPRMLEVSRTLNPELEHVQGDMRTMRLARAFDAVFVHDAVIYMTTEDDLRATMKTAHVHCRPGGVALFCPDDTRETFLPSTTHGGHDGPDGRGLRYVQWTRDVDPTDSIYETDFAFLLREPDGSVRVEHDHHVAGLFSRDTWLRLLRDVGFEGSIVPSEHGEIDRGTVDVFIGKKPR